MIIIHTTQHNLEVWLVLLSDTDQRSFFSHEAAVCCALRCGN